MLIENFEIDKPTKNNKVQIFYKATNFCEISTLDLSYVVTVKSTVEILQKFVSFSEYMTFNGRNLISNFFRLKITDQGRNLFVKKNHLLEGQVRIKLITTSIEYEIETQIEFAFNLKCLLKKLFRFPLLLDGGVRGFLFLRGLK